MTPGAASEEDAIVPLTGKRFFAVVLAKTHVKPTYNLVPLCHMSKMLPAAAVPVVLSHQNKRRVVTCRGDSFFKSFSRPGWKKLVVDSNVRVWNLKCKLLRVMIHPNA